MKHIFFAQASINVNASTDKDNSSTSFSLNIPAKVKLHIIAANINVSPNDASGDLTLLQAFLQVSGFPEPVGVGGIAFPCNMENQTLPKDGNAILCFGVKLPSQGLEFHNDDVQGSITLNGFLMLRNADAGGAHSATCSIQVLYEWLQD